MFKKLFIAIMLLTSFNAMAYQFKLSQAEFNSWDLRCKALYASTTIGRQTNFASQVPENVIQKYRSADREGAWHFCAGLIYLQRIKAGNLPPIDHKWAITGAEREILFTRGRTSKSKFIYGETSVALAEYYDFMGDEKKAEELYVEAVTLFPTSILFARKYAKYLYDKQLYTQAIKVIEKLPKEKLDNSAELCYFVGLAHYKVGAIESAQYYADRAQELGYPLTWLNEQLEK